MNIVLLTSQKANNYSFVYNFVLMNIPPSFMGPDGDKGTLHISRFMTCRDKKWKGEYILLAIY